MAFQENKTELLDKQQILEQILRIEMFSIECLNANEFSA